MIDALGAGWCRGRQDKTPSAAPRPEQGGIARGIDQ